MLSVPDWFPVWQFVVVVAVVSSGVALLAVARPRGRWGLALRRRFLLGIPWGTLLTVGVVLSSYLFAQGGWHHWHDPMTIPFHAWSYGYPVGIALAGLSHAGAGHLVGNLVGTAIYGTLAEFAWGHFPERRGSSSFSSLMSNPFVRPVAFAAGAVAASVFTAGLFGLGPVIGFSGVVFAFAGFALVRFPVATVLALAAGNVVDLVHAALRNPVAVTSPGPSFGGPWWAGIAIQGHAIGVLLGVVLGVVLAWYRDALPSPGRVWFAALAFAFSQGMWAVYTFAGDSTYVLYRAGGVALLFVLAALVTLAATASRRGLIAAIDLSRREAAFGLLAATLLALSLVAVPYNTLAVSEPSNAGEGAVHVEEYTVFYAEGVPHQLVSAYDLPYVDLTTNVTASGVVVVNPDRGIWWTEVTRSRLAFDGRRVVRVGGLGWRRTVVANRTGWTTVGGPTAYKVFLHERGEERQLAFRSDPARAAPTVAGRNVTVVPTRGGFDVAVTHNNSTLSTAPMPPRNESVRASGLRLVHDGTALYAVHDDTRVKVAAEEQYR